MSDFACQFCDGVKQSLCYPDPCYEGCWTPVADSGFFTWAVRPVSQVRVRWDSAFNFPLPDRAEYFWARSDGHGRGPNPPPGLFSVQSLHYNDLNLIVEAAMAGGRFSIIGDGRYRSLEPQDLAHTSGFGDTYFGGKALLFDSELIQIGFMLMGYIPSGNASKGLGTGHWSVEPTLLAGLRLATQTYLQSQLSQWVPIHGDPGYAGAILHYHFSLNQVLWRFLPDLPLVGNFEFNGWSFQTGSYTDPVAGPFQRASGFTYASAGPGLRLFLHNRADIGLAASYALTEPHFANQFYRMEFRWRF